MRHSGVFSSTLRLGGQRFCDDDDVQQGAATFGQLASARGSGFVLAMVARLRATCLRLRRGDAHGGTTTGAT